MRRARLVATEYARCALLAALRAIHAKVWLVAVDADGRGATLATAQGRRRVVALSARISCTCCAADPAARHG